MNPSDVLFIKHLPLPLLNGGNKPIQALNNQGSLNLNIRRYFTDVDGDVLDKTNPAIPAAMLTAYPVFMLGNFDRTGGYNRGFQTVNFTKNVFFLMTYVQGVNEPFLWNSGFNTIQNRLNKGDIVCVFTDSLDAPSTFCFIVQSNDMGGLASIISNTQTQQEDGTIGRMQVDDVSYQVDNESQLQQIWQVLTIDNLGQFKQHPFNPNRVKNPYLYKLNDFLSLGLRFVLSQYISINFLMNIESDLININFKILK